ncbi:hypothetical protein EV180_004698 [Coemansia sp. RSA 518]|nr:hypothetical protein GGH17_002176 [Coemansia sp. RSA 788]KAJ2156129.1 hypothetical protein GGH15_005624 [Coemansia sp. RSA 562]KAJ2183468.1 hypothetical protein EV181_004878 [Coemansia sp. RSA 532]KAJ2195432.1 hypothetical protein GGH18_001922 [Coemansia sp. RSA 530]KAJ2202304.1 hypothetical protein IW145_004768 [Coemansia sp. RSA 521]KAJ2212170.1 hypothetical protein IW143_003942 [Coemansia sp. RSA 520]KAJ2221320.1 hypothetical protein EV180_004698 [Coemansia sp. RSA 518]KAJ2246358.1 hyp
MTALKTPLTTTERTERLMITVSNRFEATNAIPHMGFVYVYVVDQVIGEIRASPEEYAQVTDLSHQVPGLGSAIIPPWRDMTVDKDK